MVSMGAGHRISVGDPRRKHVGHLRPKGLARRLTQVAAVLLGVVLTFGLVAPAWASGLGGSTSAGPSALLANASKPHLGAPVSVGSGQESATIYRDTLGIPHIYSSTMNGMWFGDGWAQAQDRLVQMELTRAAVLGELSSLFGPSQLSADESQRVFSYTTAEYQQQFDALPTWGQQAVEAYSAGVNSYMDQAYANRQNELKMVPQQFWFAGELLGLGGPMRPAAWQPTDTLAIGVYLAFDFGTGGGSELQNLAFLDYLQAEFKAKGDANATTDAMAVFNDARWINDPNAPTTVPANCPNGPVLTAPSQSRPGVCVPTPTPVTYVGSTSSPTASTSSSTSGSKASTAQTIQAELAATKNLRDIPVSAVLQAEQTLARDKALHLQTGKTMGVVAHGGSNAFVVAPWRSADGHALLWGAPQEGFSTPSIDYEETLHGPNGYDASGMAVAGEPFLLIGHNSNISWTTTSEETIDVGVFVEKVRYAGSPPEPSTYYFNGQWVPVQVVNESIPVLGSSPQPFTIYRTADGPIFQTDPAGGIAFSIYSTSLMHEYETLLGFAELGGDTNLTQFTASMKQIITLHNFMYADRQGNIAFFSDGLVPSTPSPLSPTIDPRLPHLGDGTQQWTTFVPFADMPHSVNPGQGYLDNWNTKPSAQLFYQQNGGNEYWGTIFHSQDIARMLSSSTHINLKYLESVEHSIGQNRPNLRDSAIYFLPILDNAYSQLVADHSPLVDPTTHPDLAQAMQVLDQWQTTLASGNPPTIGNSAMSIFMEFMEALDVNVFAGGVHPNEQYVGTVNFNDGSLGMGTYGGPGNMATANFLYHILGGSTNIFPCNTLCYTGHYFGQNRAQILVESLNDTIAILSGTGPQTGLNGNGFGTTDISQWGWNPPMGMQFNVLDPVAQLAGTVVTCGNGVEQNRSTYMMAVDMGNVPHGQQVLPPGESGFISAAGVPSPNFCDQVGLYSSFTYAPTSSTVNEVSPSTGPASGGTRVSIAGTGLRGVTAVDFGSVPASSYTVVSPKLIVATAPPGVAGNTVDVRVVSGYSPAGTEATSFDQFTYSAQAAAPPPVVTSVSPPSGVAAGGTGVTISGTSLGGATAVDFGSTPAKNFTVVSPTTITATVPGGSAGATVDVMVVTPGGTSATSVGDRFTYAGGTPVGYHALAPTRICDTRAGNPSNLSGAALANCAGKTIGGGQYIDVNVAGLGGVPTSASAVALDVAAINPKASGFLSVYTQNAAPQGTSSVNFTKGAASSELVLAQLSPQGQVSIFNSTGNTDVIVDVQGYVGPETAPGTGLFNAVVPQVICSTSPAAPLNVCSGAAGGVTSVTIPVAGAGGIPSQGVAAALVSITASGASTGGYVNVWAAGSAPPQTSVVNYAAGGTASSAAIVALGANGAIEVHASSGRPNIAITVEGYVTDASNPAAAGGVLDVPFAAQRICDSREGNPQQYTGCGTGPLGSGASMNIPVASVLSMPVGAQAVIVNITVGGGTTASALKVFSQGGTVPATPVLSWAAGHVASMQVVVPMGDSGGITLQNAAGSVNVVVDVVGWVGPAQ